eukprot:m.839841 g.839841  ORF g.839841 m.839841 type:complete len:341 (+) comp23469_c0_seq6:31-1053(+)
MEDNWLICTFMSKPEHDLPRVHGSVCWARPLYKTCRNVVTQPTLFTPMRCADTTVLGTWTPWNLRVLPRDGKSLLSARDRHETQRGSQIRQLPDEPARCAWIMQSSRQRPFLAVPVAGPMHRRVVPEESTKNRFEERTPLHAKISCHPLHRFERLLVVKRCVWCSWLLGNLVALPKGTFEGGFGKGCHDGKGAAAVAVDVTQSLAAERRPRRVRAITCRPPHGAPETTQPPASRPPSLLPPDHPTSCLQTTQPPASRPPTFHGLLRESQSTYFRGRGARRGTWGRRDTLVVGPPQPRSTAAATWCVLVHLWAADMSVRDVAERLPGCIASQDIKWVRALC